MYDRLSQRLAFGPYRVLSALRRGQPLYFLPLIGRSANAQNYALLPFDQWGSAPGQSSHSTQSGASQLVFRDRSAQDWAIGYFEKISSTRLNAFSAAFSGVIPDPTNAPDMLVLDLRIGWVEDPEIRHRRAEQGLIDIRHTVWIGGVQPPRVQSDLPTFVIVHCKTGVC
jgi:hypothetical protein